MNSSNTSKAIGKNIKHYRLKAGLSQVGLAKKAGINDNYYARVERGEVSPTLEKYEKIAKALKVKSSELLPF